MAEQLQSSPNPHRQSQRKIISAHGGVLEASPRLRRFLAIYEEGEMLVAATALNDPELQTLRRRAESLDIRLHTPREASLDEISAANANVADVEKYATQARQTLLAILSQAARSNASDILLGRNDVQGRVRFRINGLMQDHRLLDPERVTAVANAAINACDAGDSLASPSRPVRAAITARKMLPANVLGVRLQYAPTSTGFVLIMRLSYAAAAIHCQSLEEAGVGTATAAAIRGALQSPAGVFVVAGPTEHGKSTTP